MASWLDENSLKYKNVEGTEIIFALGCKKKLQITSCLVLKPCCSSDGNLMSTLVHMQALHVNF